MSKEDKKLHSIQDMEKDYKKFLKTPPHQLIMKLESRVKHLEGKVFILERVIDSITEAEKKK
jgi:hypothetical protein